MKSREISQRSRKEPLMSRRRSSRVERVERVYRQFKKLFPTLYELFYFDSQRKRPLSAASSTRPFFRRPEGPFGIIIK